MRDCMSCFTPPDSGIRDISLRKANDREVKNQEGGTNLFFIFSQFTRTDAVDHEIETECIRRFAIAFENGCLGGCAGRWFTTMGPHIGGVFVCTHRVFWNEAGLVGDRNQSAIVTGASLRTVR